MEWEQDIIVSAIEYLLDGEENEAADILRTCSFEDSEVVDYWMDGSKQLDGLSYELGCPRSTFEILSRASHPITQKIVEALNAVLPSDSYIKNIRPRFNNEKIPLRQESINNEPTGWSRLDRNVDKISSVLARAKNEEDFQSVGLLCREAIISLAQAVYNPELHGTLDEITPSETDANRMLQSFLAIELKGKTNEIKRKLAKTTLQLAVELQHRRTAQFRDAALCAEATRSIINIIAIITGRRDP